MKSARARVLTISLGCDKNLVDSEHFLHDLSRRGYVLTDDETQADAAIVNTCCFIHDAQRESVQTMLALADLKRAGALKALIVTGCFAQRYQTEIREAIPEVDCILGTASIDHVHEALMTALHGGRVDFFDDINRSYRFPARRVLGAPSHAAYLKIAEGCDKRCAYCIIPSLRGHYRSVPEGDLIREARFLETQGVKELILVAQETTRYGVDLYGKKRLAHLLQRLCRETEAIRWIRLLYCYPEEIDDELIDVIRREEKIVKYLDIPIQSGSDRILKKMGRHTSNERIRALVETLRRKIPEICLRTTLITGFPSETAADHRESMALVSDLAFDRLGVFAYSREEGTGAYAMRPQVKEALKKRRRTQLMKLQQEIAFEKAETMRGKILTVITEGEVEENADGGIVYAARTYRDAPDVDGLLFFTGRKPHMSGDFVSVRVTKAEGYDLIGVEIPDGERIKRKDKARGRGQA